MDKSTWKETRLEMQHAASLPNCYIVFVNVRVTRNTTCPVIFPARYSASRALSRRYQRNHPCDLWASPSGDFPESSVLELPERAWLGYEALIFDLCLVMQLKIRSATYFFHYYPNEVQIFQNRNIPLKSPKLISCLHFVKITTEVRGKPKWELSRIWEWVKWVELTD